MEYNSKEILKVALDYLDKAIAEHPTAELYMQRGRIYNELGDKQRALEDAAKAYQMDTAMMFGTSGEFSNTGGE